MSFKKNEFRPIATFSIFIFLGPMFVFLALVLIFGSFGSILNWLVVALMCYFWGLFPSIVTGLLFLFLMHFYLNKVNLNEVPFFSAIALSFLSGLISIIAFSVIVNYLVGNLINFPSGEVSVYIYLIGGVVSMICGFLAFFLSAAK